MNYTLYITHIPGSGYELALVSPVYGFGGVEGCRSDKELTALFLREGFPMDAIGGMVETTRRGRIARVPCESPEN